MNKEGFSLRKSPITTSIKNEIWGLILMGSGFFRWIVLIQGYLVQETKQIVKRYSSSGIYTGKNRDAEGDCPIMDEETGVFTIGLFMDWTVI